MKTTEVTLLSLLLLLLVSACSRQAATGQFQPAVGGKPRFTVAAADLVRPAEISTNSSPSGEHATIVIHLQLSGAKAEDFRRFTREHLNHQAELAVGSNVVAEPFIVTEIADGRADLAFSSLAEAQAVRDLLQRK